MDEPTETCALEPEACHICHRVLTRVSLLDLAFPFGNGRMIPLNGPCEKGPDSFFFLKEIHILFYLFIYDCVESSFLCEGFL